MFGHVAPGTGFLLIGLWHLFNHIKLYAIHPSSYSAPPWFPLSNPRYRYLEPYVIMASATSSILAELFVGPHRHQPLDFDGTIPSNHLHNFEHASISLAILVYGAFTVLIDKFSPKTPRRFNYFIASVAFAQELLLFHLHSTDHTGAEGQYHFFLQLVITVSLLTSLLAIAFPNSFMVSFVRSLSIFFQGVWLIALGIMLWTPSLVPKGCFLHEEDGHKLVRCSGEESLSRAKSLINLEFSWYLTIITIFGVSFYLVLVKIYGDHKVDQYSSLPMQEEKEEGSYDIESQKKCMLGNS